MTQITRVYDTPDQANAAVAELAQRGFEHVACVAGGKSGNGADVLEPIRSAGVSPSHAEAIAERVRRGGAVVSVRAPFGTATTVTGILNRHAPVEPDAATSAPRQDGAAEAAPLSAALELPVLAETPSAGSRATASSGPRTLSQMLGIPELIDSNTFFSGFPLLIRSRPFSSLSASQEPYSALAQNQAPSAGVVEDPAPLSTWLGLPVLMSRRPR